MNIKGGLPGEDQGSAGGEGKGVDNMGRRRSKHVTHV
jgi:hypothetical protein